MEMKITKLLLLLITGLFISFSAMSQEEQNAETQKEEVQKPEVKASLDGGTIKSQFEYMVNKSNRYEVYRVVKIEWLNKMKANVADSLNLAGKNLQEAKNTISTQSNEISSLKSELQKVNDQLNQETKEKNSISFLGMLMKKSAYNGLMWTIVGGLLLLAFVSFGLFKRSNSVTIETRQSLKDTQEEFEKHRKWALDREQKLARELHKAKNQM